MKFRIEKRPAFKIVGIQRKFGNKNSFKQIPKFWDEFLIQNCINRVIPMTQTEQLIFMNNIGEYGICIDHPKNNYCQYIIAGEYKNVGVPDNMSIFDIPEKTWAIFDCYGDIPKDLQLLTTKIFRQWLPNNKEWKLDGNITMEWYDTKIFKDGYKGKKHAAVLIPVRKK